MIVLVDVAVVAFILTLFLPPQWRWTRPIKEALALVLAVALAVWLVAGGGSDLW